MHRMRSGTVLLFLFVASGLFVLLLLPSALGPPSRADGLEWFSHPLGTGSTCTQAQPCALQTSLSLARDSEVVYLAGGVYTSEAEAVASIGHSITVYGGWDGAPSGPVMLDAAAHRTVLDGDGARRVVHVSPGLEVTLQGLEIINGGDVAEGAGLWAQDSHLTVRHTAFYSNVVSSAAKTYGGGAFIQGGTAWIESCSFRGNRAIRVDRATGGALYIDNTLGVTLANSLIENNDAYSASGVQVKGSPGAFPAVLVRGNQFVGNGRGRSAGSVSRGAWHSGLDIQSANARVEGNLFQDNYAVSNRAALSVWYGTLYVEGNLFLNNEAHSGTSALALGAVSQFTVTNNLFAHNDTWRKDGEQECIDLLTGCHGVLMHNTIAHNDSGYGIRVRSDASAALTNTILVRHTVAITVEAGGTAWLEGTLWGAGDWANGTDWNGEGHITTGSVNLWAAPGFVAADLGDYHLTSTSQAVDAGVVCSVARDLDGDRRPIGAGHDIGSDEYVLHAYLPMVRRE